MVAGTFLNNETYTSSDKNKYYFSEDNEEKQLILEICNDYDGSYKCYQYYNINIQNNKCKCTYYSRKLCYLRHLNYSFL